MKLQKTKKVEKNVKIPQEVSYFEIYRYGTWLEKLATISGVLFGVLSGGGACYQLVQLGEFSTAFVDRTVHTDRLSSHLPLASLFGGGKQLVNASFEENMQALIEDAEAMCIGLFVTVAISIVLCILSMACINWSSLRQITRIRTKFLEAVLGQDMEWFDTDSEFNLASKMSEDMMKLKDGMGEKLAVVSNLLGTALISIAQSFPLGWELTLACLTVLPLLLAASIALSNIKVGEYKKTIVAFAGERKEINRYGKLLEPAERYGRKRGLFTGLGTGFNWVLTYSLNAIGLSYGIRLMLQEIENEHPDGRRYVIGNIIAIMFGMYMATQSITFIVPHSEVFAAARGAAATLFSIMDRKPKIDSMSNKGKKPGKLVGSISLENVTFSYPSRPNVKVLQAFSLHVRPGESVALVGSSGCGKSTILQLLQRLYDPASGVAKIDNHDLKSLNVNYLRSSLGVVGQEPVLFRGTIRDNIMIGYPAATDKEIVDVAKMAYAHDFITRLPNGYNTLIGERGASLSGGQKQRIAIARCLLREPSILLLDEATSALDPQSERQVQAALDRASKGRTTLTVSHRLSTIINVDRIICMDQGSIIETGTHSELMNAKGFYYKLVTTNKGALMEPIPREGDDAFQEKTLENSDNISRRSTKRLVREVSTRKAPSDWMKPRISICSAGSGGLQNCSYQHSGTKEEIPDDQEEKVKSVSDWDLLKLNSPEWPLLVIGSIAAIVQGACFPIFAVLYSAVTAIFAYTDHTQLLQSSNLYSGLFIAFAALAGLSICLQCVTFTNAGLRMTTRLRQQYFSSLLKQEIGYFDRESNSVGALCARLSGDTAEVQGATGLRVGLILQGVSSVLIGFLVAVCYNWKLTLLGTAFLPISVGSIWLEGIVSQKSGQEEREALELATSIATEAVISIKTVQSLGIEQSFIEKFKSALRVSCDAIRKKDRWRGLVFGTGVYVPYITFISVIVYGARLVAKEGLAYPLVFLVTESVMYGAYMLGQSLIYAPDFNTAKDCGARILAIIHRQPRVVTEPGVKDLPHWSAVGKFSLREAEFSYPTRPQQRVLRGFDLRVEAGKTVALVGPSGCGKSTVLQLLQRFYDPDSGTIELDGRDIRRSLTLPRLRQQLGVVQQEPVLFDRSLAENIAYGDNSRRVTQAEVIAAARAANIHDFIVSLPQGYDTSLGASGAQLSGGQKQRVCIARALIRSPRLLLLDEATSALDANSERAVTEALEKAAEGRTCITIAHRLSTIKNADLICVLDKGKIIEKGTHEELMDMKGFYYVMEQGQQLA